IPAFSASGGFLQIDARLFDTAGKLKDERTSLRPKLIAWEACLFGALPAQFSGMPAFPQVDQTRAEFAPQVARVMPEFFPDNPIALEGLNGLYLNSEKTLGLKENEVASLLSWLYAGGHLVICIEQQADLATATWLRDILPVETGGAETRKMKG